MTLVAPATTAKGSPTLRLWPIAAPSAAEIVLFKEATLLEVLNGLCRKFKSIILVYWAANVVYLPL